MKSLFAANRTILLFDFLNILWRATVVKVHGGELATSNGRVWQGGNLAGDQRIVLLSCARRQVA